MVVYGSQEELLSRGVDAAKLLGLMKKNGQERDEFVYEDDEEIEEIDKGGSDMHASVKVWILHYLMQ